MNCSRIDSSNAYGKGGDALQGSSLSKPFPNQNCNCSPQVRYKSTGTDKRLEEESFETAFLQEYMEKLSIKEQENAQLGVHGKSIIASDVLRRLSQIKLGFAEHPEFLALKFKELASNIEHSSSKPGFAAYELARQQDKDYVDDQKFKIGFLRADRYDAEKAAHRLLRYLGLKLELFGREKLTHDICWEDLGDDARKFLELGGLQLLPKRDKAGRRVVWFGEVMKDGNIDGMLQGIRKAFFYFTSTLAEHDDEIGRVKGYVVIMWRVHNPVNPDPKGVKAVSYIRDACPFKISAHHFCHPRLTFSLDTANKFAKMFLLAFQNKSILRVCRPHYGTAIECKYGLLHTYGCPTDCFPDQHENAEDSKNEAPFHNRYVKMWIVRRLQLENEKKQRRKTIAIDISPPLLRQSQYLELLGDIDNDADDDSSFEKILCQSVATIDTMGSLDFDDPIEEQESSSDDDDGDDDDDGIRDVTFVVAEGQTFQEESSGETPDLPSIVRPASYAVDATRLLGDGSSDGGVCAEDVLLGKSPHLRGHAGNIKLREIVIMYYDHYNASYNNQHSKTVISEEIVELIACSGGRFLKEDQSGLWVEVSKKEARVKVSSTFRGITKKGDRAKAKHRQQQAFPAE